MSKGLQVQLTLFYSALSLILPSLPTLIWVLATVEIPDLSFLVLLGKTLVLVSDKDEFLGQYSKPF